MGISVKRTGKENIQNEMFSVFRIQVNANNCSRDLIQIALSAHVPIDEQNPHRIQESKCENCLLCRNLRLIFNQSSYLFHSYLCGYIYLKSLDLDSSRCLFIHVPPIDDEHTVDDIRDGVLTVIEECIYQLQTGCGCRAKQ